MALKYRDRVYWLPEIPQPERIVFAGRDAQFLRVVGRHVRQLLVVSAQRVYDLSGLRVVQIRRSVPGGRHHLFGAGQPFRGHHDVRVAQKLPYRRTQRRRIRLLLLAVTGQIAGAFGPFGAEDRQLLQRRRRSFRYVAVDRRLPHVCGIIAARGQRQLLTRMKSHRVHGPTVTDVLQQAPTALYRPDARRMIGGGGRYDGLAHSADRYLPNAVAMTHVLLLHGAAHGRGLEARHYLARLRLQFVRGFDLLRRVCTHRCRI